MPGTLCARRGRRLGRVWPCSCGPQAESKVTLGTADACGTQWYGGTCRPAIDAGDRGKRGPRLRPERSGAERNPGRGGLRPHHPGFGAASRPQEAFSVHRYRIHSSVQLPGRACGHRGEPQGWSTDGHCHSLAFWPFILGPQATTPLLSQGDRWDPVAASGWQAVPALCC